MTQQKKICSPDKGCGLEKVLRYMKGGSDDGDYIANPACNEDTA